MLKNFMTEFNNNKIGVAFNNANAFIQFIRKINTNNTSPIYFTVKDLKQITKDKIQEYLNTNENVIAKDKDIVFIDSVTSFKGYTIIPYADFIKNQQVVLKQDLKQKYYNR